MPQYDPAARRKATRAGRMRGCHIYIPAEELERAGFPPDAPPPYYRLRGYQRSANARAVVVDLYATK